LGKGLVDRPLRQYLRLLFRRYRRHLVAAPASSAIAIAMRIIIMGFIVVSVFKMPQSG
jgi:hypothetical protein